MRNIFCDGTGREAQRSRNAVTFHIERKRIRVYRAVGAASRALYASRLSRSACALFGFRDKPRTPDRLLLKYRNQALALGKPARSAAYISKHRFAEKRKSPRAKRRNNGGCTRLFRGGRQAVARFIDGVSIRVGAAAPKPSTATGATLWSAVAFELAPRYRNKLRFPDCSEAVDGVPRGLLHSHSWAGKIETERRCPGLYFRRS